MRLAPGLKYRGRPELQIQFVRDILRNVGALPGVRTAAVSTDVPLLGNPLYIMRFEGRPPVTPSQAPVANFFSVTPGFFETMGMHVTHGRAIAPTDRVDTPLVAVVNQTLAAHYFPGEDPIGKRLEIAFSTPPRWREIVGVVADVKISGLDQDTPVQVYTAYFQSPGLQLAPPIAILAKTASDPASAGASIKAAVLQADRSQPVYAMQPMTQVVAKSIEQRQIAFYLLLFFAASSLALAAIGIYGVTSYSVAERTAEIGIRMALGAQSSQVLLQVTRQGMVLVGAGLLTGLAGALGLTRLMNSLLFHVQPTDPLVLAVAVGAIATSALVACLLPARRAARVDPVAALRAE
jgi:putative ABC transport system permease protein